MGQDMQKRINRCRHSHMDIRPPYIRKCGRNADDITRSVAIKDEDCEKCPYFDSRYIEYPITVNGIDYEKYDTYNLDKPGLVKIRPCGEKYGGKTYLGLLLGDLPASTHVSYDKKTKRLTVGMVGNPAIFVFKTKEVVYGCESWWGRIKDPSELTDITDETIDSQWYVAALKAMTPDTGEEVKAMTPDTGEKEADAKTGTDEKTNDQC